MLAIIYLVAATYFGDCICRRLFRFMSLQHRIAASFLVGLLISTWITFLTAVGFHRLNQPLLAANLPFLIIFGVTAYLAHRFPTVNEGHSLIRPTGTVLWDVVWLAGFSIFACWLIFATLNFSTGQFQIPFKAWTDFGANISLTQSFALGHNFPPQHPFFPGEFIRYHFLFWFQAANLEFLGLNPVWSINLLSILSLVALLVLIMTFGEVLFGSRVVGRVGALLFFFSSSLSYLPFLRSQTSVLEALNSIVRASEFLASGYPFRGEEWGALSVNVFAYQRHLISGIGVFFVALVFAVERYRAAHDAGAKKTVSEPGVVATASNNQVGFHDPTDKDSKSVDAAANAAAQRQRNINTGSIGAFVFAGILLGLLPYWNSPTYLAALAVFGCLFLFVPLRVHTACLLIAAVVVGLPQVLLLRSGNTMTYQFFHPGYTLENPTLWLIVKYLSWTFGVKWILLGVAMVFATSLQRRLFLAVLSLVAIVFLFQLSVDVFNNHKLLNIWVTVVNVYAAYALWQIARLRIAGVVLTIMLALATVCSGTIDLFPLHNDPVLTVPYRNDRLTQWVFDNTQPSDVFLTHPLLTHPILFAGRKIFMGYTLFAWTAGYNVAEREALYRRLFQEQDAAELTRLLRENHISYVAIDDGVRHNETLPDLNEPLLNQHFQRVFEDTAHVYDNVVIYKVH